MAVAEEKTSPETTEKSWHGIVLQTLKRNDIRLVPYVPDRVLTPLIKNLHADPFFTTFATAREEEAVGIVSGAWMGGMRSAVLMQTSGFATLANVLASLAIPGRLHQHRTARAAHPGAGDDSDRFLLSRCGEGREEGIGVQVLDQRRQDAVGHIGDQADIVALEGLQHDAVPALLRRFGRGFFLRNRHCSLLYPRRSLVRYPRRSFVRAHPWDAAKLDAIGGIVNMS